MTFPEQVVQYRVTGMDCADDAAEIEHAARQVTGVVAVRVSVASHLMTLRVSEPDRILPGVERAVTNLGYIVDLLQDGHVGDTHTAPGYRRALWAVALLNIGYGVVQALAGFLSDSQALKADALDFIGDGLITMLGVIAIGWGLAWRARSAMVQGTFLGVLGVGVLADSILRWQAGYEPDASLMGTFGLLALGVNVLAAAILLPHRTGDANVRAVWLFSRNDAIGNVAVVVAAGMVAWSDTRWPDLAVAMTVAGLFLHSSWSIIVSARHDLQDAD